MAEERKKGESLYWYAEIINTLGKPNPAKFFGRPETKTLDGKLRLKRIEATGPSIQNIQNIPDALLDADLDQLFQFFNDTGKIEELPIPEESKKPVSFVYKNYEGITSIRDVIVHSFYFGVTEWHEEEQWLLHGYDVDKQADRTFALKDCDFLSMTTL